MRVAVCTLIAAGVLSGCGSGDEDDADLLITNAAVYTVDPDQPRAEAVAVKDGEITFVGDAQEAQSLAGDGTEEIDAGGKTVMPGIHDGHTHPLSGGQQLSEPNLGAEPLTLPE